MSNINQFIIKNMVCPRCIESVRQVFSQLGIPVIDIQLGTVSLATGIDESQKQVLRKNLMAKGFELLDDKRTQLVNQIKTIVIEEIHHQKELSPVNFSTLLAERLHHDYAYLSRLFSAVEGRTIEKFVIAQKIEKVKELLIYGQLTLSEIAFQMEYSSSAYLSSQFKKVTGMTPSEFKHLQSNERQSIDVV